jgi:hypothetical protein
MAAVLVVGWGAAGFGGGCGCGCSGLVADATTVASVVVTVADATRSGWPLGG